MSNSNKILEHAINHWHKNFTGISALTVAKELNLTHDEVLRVFDDFEIINIGTLRKNEKLYTIQISLEEPRIDDKLKRVITSIFFPSKEVLEKSYNDKGFHEKKIPEYIVRLHKGDSQIHQLYFNLSVLKKYFDNQEVYFVKDSISSGYIRLNDSYVEGLSEEEINDILFAQIRFGKRKLVDGNMMVTTILHDLAELPRPEQRHWHAHENEEPRFAEKDTEYADYYRRAFLADWVESDDPLEKCLEELGKINGLFANTNIFTQVQNTYLRYPIVNTRKDFYDSCSELYKLVGPDNIKIKILKSILIEHLGFKQEDFKHTKSGRAKSVLQLLEMVTQKTETDGLLAVIKEIQKHRISADHRVLSPDLTDINYMQEFQNLCSNLHKELVSFNTRIKKVILSNQRPT